MNQENSSLPSFGVQGSGNYSQESNPKPAQPVSTFSSQSTIRPRSPRRPLLKLLIVVVAIIAVLILGSYATFGYVLKPDNSVSTALNKIATDTTSHSKISLKTLSSDPKTDLANFQIAIDLDRSNKNSPKVQSSMDLHISGMADVSLEMKTVDNVIYYKISNIPELYASTYGQYADKWYSVPIQTLKEYSANYSSSTTYDDVYKKSLFDWYKELVRSKYISEIKFAGVGLYAGQIVRKYSFTVNRDQIQKAMDDSRAKALGSLRSNSYLNQINTSTTREVDNIVFSPVYVYLDLTSNTFRGAEVSINNNSKSQKNAMFDLTGIHISMEYANPNTAQQIIAPADAVSIENYFTEAKQAASNARIKANLSMTRTIIESSYSGSAKGYSGTCLVNDMMKIKEEMSKIHSTFICRDSAKAYIAYATLASTSTMLYQCADSLGNMKTLNKAPTSFVCK